MDVRLPDGTVIKNVPDGITKEQLTQKLAANGYDIAKLGASSAPTTGVNAIPLPAGGAERMKADAEQPAKPEPSFKDKILGGLEAAGTLATGATSGAVGYIGGALGGIAGSIASGDFGTEQGTRRAKEAAEEAAAKLTYQPRTESGQQYVQGVGHALEASGVAGLPLGGELAVVGNLARPASAQAIGRAAEITKPVTNGASNLANRVAQVRLTPQIAAERAELAQKAINYGIDITPDMLYNNKYANITRQAFEHIPLAGGAAEERQIAFNRAIANLIGADKTKKGITPDVFDAAMRKSGETIGAIAEKTSIPLNEEFAAALSDVVGQSAKFDVEDVSRIVGNYAGELTAKAAENNGVIDGVAFRKLNSAIGKKIRKTTDGDLKDSLSNLQEAMQDALEKNIQSPEDMQALLEARKQYAIGKTIEPLVAKAQDGNISPAGLMARVTADSGGKSRMATGRAGELGDLARIGQQFLKEPGSSNTSERNLVHSAMTGGLGAAAYMHPAAAGTTWAAANLYNRLGPRVARRIVAGSAPRDLIPPMEMPVAPSVRTPLQARVERQRTQQQTISEIGNAQSIDEAINAASKK